MDISAFRLKNGFDRTNALVAAFVFLFTFVVYRMTVAPTLSFWDCGEFLACSYILGIPHPPGSPLFVVLGRIFSVLPIASDICFRMNMISVISSAVANLFGYLVVVRMIRFWYRDTDFTGWKRAITYIGGVVGSMFMAFATTNWGNAVEAEVYGLAMLIMTMIFWLMLQYYDMPETPKGQRVIYLVCYLALLGVALHLTTFLIVPIAAVFFILKRGAPTKAWIALCAFFVLDLLAIMLFADGRGGFPVFVAFTLLMILALAVLVYKYINWPVLLAVGAFSMIMTSFYAFFFGIIGAAVLFAVVIFLAKRREWATGLIIIILAAMGWSFNIFVPIRSHLDPRIDENNTKRSFKTFVDFLDRKQYGSESMVERMFHRRGTWAHQFGRHANMGFWSYFEEQYSGAKGFGILFLLGLYGIAFTIKKKTEIGLTFLIFLILASVGLILYMNFADGTKYDATTGDAYQEVRNRDYFFTPAFIYFGLALGLGVAAVMETVRQKTATAKWSKFQKPAMAILSLLIFLPTVALSDNYFENDRSRNYYPRDYAYNLLQNCDKNAILFTSGDNDTFPLWCAQEVYSVRRDVRVVNLSLFNTDWYIQQMKDQYNVPMSLSDKQIVWSSFRYDQGEVMRPEQMFYDRARKRQTYLVPAPYQGRIVKLQDMMVDDVVLTNDWKDPVYFSSEPYAESPLKLRDFSVADGILYKLVKDPPARKIDAENGFRLYTEVYRYTGLNDPNICRDENASGVELSLGFNALRITDEFQRTNQTDRAKSFLQFIIDKYPEFFQSYLVLSDIERKAGDSAGAKTLMNKMQSTLQLLHDKNPSNPFYTQDLGLAKFYNGDTTGGLDLLWECFNADPNSAYAYRKLMQVLYETRRSTELLKATQMFADYKINRNDPLVQQILGQAGLMNQTPTTTTPPGGP